MYTFCLISGEIQHSILRKVSYLFTNKTKRPNKFVFVLFENIGERERARSARKKTKEFSPSPALTPSAGGQQIPRGVCFLSRVLDGL